MAGEIAAGPFFAEHLTSEVATSATKSCDHRKDGGIFAPIRARPRESTASGKCPVDTALRRLGYSNEQIAAIETFAKGTGSLEGAPHINRATLKARGFDDAAIARVEAGLSGAFQRTFAFNRFVLGDEFCTQKLGIDAGVVAVTKADAVDAETLQLALEEARELVPGADVVAVSARTGQGLDELRASLAALAARVRRRESSAPARLFVDRRESALNEAGDVLIPMSEGAFKADHIRAELGEVIIGKHPGRRTPDELTLFKSLGIAVEDVAAAAYVVRRARETGVGQTVTM